MTKQKTQTGTRKRAKVRKQAKRYSPGQKKKILDFIAEAGRGGQTKAVAKFGVTAATISSWRKKALGAVKARPAAKASKGPRVSGHSKELRAIEELRQLLQDIESTEKKLSALKASYKKAKAKL